MKKIGVLLFILVIFSFHMLMNYHILSASRFSHWHDEEDYIYQGLFCHRYTNLGDLDTITAQLKIFCHPPLLKFIHAFCWWFTGFYNLMDINLVILLSNSLFLLVLLTSVYGIGNQLYGRKAGLLSAFLISMFPLVFGHSRVAMLDFPLASMTALTVYLLLKSRHFSSPAYSLLAGFGFALAELTKETAVIFILPPLIYYFFQAVSLKENSKVVRNFILSLASFGIVTGAVYLRPDNLRAFDIYRQKIYVDSFSTPAYYFTNFSMVIGPLLVIACLPLVMGYLINIRRREKLFLYWFLVPLILFSLSSSRTIRYILPLSIPFCLIITQELFNNTLIKKIRLWYISILIIIATLQYSLLNYGLMKIKDSFLYCEQGILSPYKDKYYSAYTSLFEVFKKEARQNNLQSLKEVFFLFDIAEISAYLRLKSSLCRLPFYVSRIDIDSVHAKILSDINWAERGANADYIVDKDGDKNIMPYAKFIEEGLRYGFNQSRNKFKLIATIGLYDGSHIYIYKRIPGEYKYRY